MQHSVMFWFLFYIKSNYNELYVIAGVRVTLYTRIQLGSVYLAYNCVLCYKPVVTQLYFMLLPMYRIVVNVIVPIN